MKKTFLHFFAIFLTSIVLFSCLGDTKSMVESNGYALVSENNGNKVALVPLNYLYTISSSSLSAYNPGDIIYINYKLNFNDASSTGVIPADYLSVVEGRVYRNGISDPIKSDPIPQNSEVNKFKSLDIPFYSSNRLLLDRWLFEYKYDRKKGEDVDGLSFFYDVNNQSEAANTDDPTYIIDVRLNVSGLAVGTETTTVEGGINVNFERFRQLVKPSEIKPEGSKVNIWFRYPKVDETGLILLKGKGLIYSNDD